jgi:septal ring factor EnvC (AmiA/AmiB activator)
MYKVIVLLSFACCPVLLAAQTPDTTAKRIQQQINEVSREIDSIKIKAVDQSKVAEALVDDLQQVQDRLQKVRKEKASSVQTPEQKKQEEELVRQYKALSKKRDDALHVFDQYLIRLDERVGYLNELKKSIGIKTDK